MSVHPFSGTRKTFDFGMLFILGCSNINTMMMNNFQDDLGLSGTIQIPRPCTPSEARELLRTLRHQYRLLTSDKQIEIKNLVVRLSKLQSA